MTLSDLEHITNEKTEKLVLSPRGSTTRIQEDTRHNRCK